MSESWSEIFPAGFDASQQQAPATYTPLPAGWYTVSVDDAAVVDTRAIGGKRLKVMFTVLSATYSGRKVFHSINIKNQNQKAVEIGLRELGALSKACGLVCVRDSAEFVGKVIDIRVAIRADPGRDPENVVKGFRPVASQAVPRPTLPTYVTAPSASPAPTTTAPSATPALARTPAPPEAEESPLPWQV